MSRREPMLPRVLSPRRAGREAELVVGHGDKGDRAPPLLRHNLLRGKRALPARRVASRLPTIELATQPLRLNPHQALDVPIEAGELRLVGRAYGWAVAA